MNYNEYVFFQKAIAALEAIRNFVEDWFQEGLLSFAIPQYEEFDTTEFMQVEW